MGKLLRLTRVLRAFDVTDVRLDHSAYTDARKLKTIRAYVTALPKEMVPDDCMVEEPNSKTYKTASGQHIEDGGKGKPHV